MDLFVECIVSDSHTANFLDLPPLIGMCQIFHLLFKFFIRTGSAYYSN